MTALQAELNEATCNKARRTMNRSGASRVHFWIAALLTVGSGFSFGAELISFQGDLSQGSLVLGLVEPRSVSYTHLTLPTTPYV